MGSIKVQKLEKSFGVRNIFHDVSFELRRGERLGLIGANGAGKSTLLKCLIGDEDYDGGTFVISEGESVGYLQQDITYEDDVTLRDTMTAAWQDVLRLEGQLKDVEKQMQSQPDNEELMNRYAHMQERFEWLGGFEYESMSRKIIQGLGFGEDDMDRPVQSFSGGQKTRINLAKALVRRPDYLFLDEPTNHLDIPTREIMEDAIEAFGGTCLVVSHDRYFLDRVVTKIVELDNGTGTVFSGNYTAYSDKKAMLRDARIRAYLNQKQEIRHQEAVIAKLKSFNREKSIRRAESREKMLEKIDRLEKPMDIDDSMDIRLEPDVESGKDVLTVTGLSKSFDSQTLFTDVNFEIKRGERVAIIGNNGTGKTTLLKIINQLLPADAGEIRLGSKVHIGYYDQEHQVLHMDKTLFDEIQDTYPSMNNTQIRNTLASFLFTGDDVFKLIRDLSGGERGRVSLAKLMLSDANFLLLDEPTNHLDITSKEILESALCRYTGTVLYVSHDRYFINRTATRILDLTGQSLINYIGSYDYYLEKKDVVEAAFAARNSRTSTVPGSSQSPDRPSQGSPNDLKLEWKAQKEEQARIRRIQNELRKTEDSIHALETRDSEIDALLTLEEVYTDVPRLMELNKEKEEIAGQLEKLYQSWEELAEKA